MSDSDEEDEWCPRAQVGLEDLIATESKQPIICSTTDDVHVAQARQPDTASSLLPPSTYVSMEHEVLPAAADKTVTSPAACEDITSRYREATGHTAASGSARGAEPDGPSSALGAASGNSGGYGYGGDGSNFAFGGQLRQASVRQEDVVRNAEQDKAEGTALFQAGQYFSAYQAWKRSIDALEAIESGSMSEDAKRVLVALCSNSAQALLKCPDVQGAVTEMAACMADKALSIDPSSTRALFRRGCAYANAQGWALARKDFEQVLRLEPNNEAARRELEKLEESLPPAASDVLARRQEDAVAVSVPKDAESAVRMAQKESERFRQQILAAADRKGCVTEWCKRFNKIQVLSVDWAKHQLKDPESLQDLLTLRGPLFQSMDAQQREDFLCAYEFVQEARTKHGDEITELCKS